ncbi:MAG: hypothetical protein Q4E75_07160 [bacterium]|nr:hypothetical protein [bacterium]
MSKIFNTITKLPIEGKISALEKLNAKGIKVCELPENYISHDNIMVKNVIINLKRHFSNGVLNTSQIDRCEKMGIRLVPENADANYRINFLKKALDEGIDLPNKILAAEENCLIYKYASTLREDCKSSKLSEMQIKECTDTLKIILPKQEIKKILNNKIRQCALQNITLFDGITKPLI